MYYNKIYFLFFLLLFCTEASIAYFFKDGFIRHSFGDFLVVIMLYCLIKSFINLKPILMAFIVLVISFIVEFLQLTPLLENLNLQDNTYAKLILGNTFNISDLVAYVLGVITIIGIESKRTVTA